MVKRMARHVSQGLPAHVQREDLVQDGLVGLIDAIVRSSRSTTGAQFASYVAQRAKGAMVDGLRANDPATRMLHREMRRVEQAIQKLSHVLGRAPQEGEVAAALELSLGEYQRLLQDAHGYQLVSLEDLTERLDVDDHATAHEILAQFAHSQADPSVVLERSTFKQALARAIEALPHPDQDILHHYYMEERKMHEIGALLGLSESRVSQLHTQAIAALRVSVLGSQAADTLRPRRKAR